MAEAPPPSATAEEPVAENAAPQSNQPDPSQSSAAVLPPPPPPPLQQQAASPSPSASNLVSSTPPSVNPNPTPPIITPPPPSVHPYTTVPGGGILPPTAPSFRPASLPVPQFSPLPNPSLQSGSFQNPGVQNPSVQPPGVSAPPQLMIPGAVSGVGSVPGSMPPAMTYQVPAGQPMRPYAPLPNGYPAPQGAIPPPGVIRYASPYPSLVRPPFPTRPPGTVGILPPLLRPVPGLRGPTMLPGVRPAVIPIVAPAEKPQTTVYVGKIASTVDNDFMLSILRLCGPVKGWKRAQDPTNGTPKGFGFCEFETAEGILRALRLLTKLSVDGQELVLNANQATKDYLQRYVEKKRENSKKPAEAETKGDDKTEEDAPASEKEGSVKLSEEGSKKDTDDDSGNKENADATSFGIVTDEDKEADREAVEKLSSMIEERLKNNPLPPPPPQGGPDGAGSLNSDTHTKSRDDDADNMNNDAAENRTDDDTTNEPQPKNEQEKPETASPERSKRYDRSSRERDRERDKRDKERELERYERERERERAKRERERELRIREAEQLFKEQLKDWEIREREKEYQRQHEKEREKDRQHQRRKEIRDQEWDSDDDEDDSRRRRRRLDEKRRRRIREKEEDLADKLKEEEEIAESKRKAEEQKQLQQKQKDEIKLSASQIIDGSDKSPQAEVMDIDSKENAVDHAHDELNPVHGNHAGEGVTQNGNSEESAVLPDSRQIGSAPARKLGFGLTGSGKRTTVPSVFHEEDDDDAHKDKKMRPLVPIDYSNEELQAASGTAAANLAQVPDAVKRSSSVNHKEERPDGERERSKRSHDRSGQRDRERNDGDNHAENRGRTRERDRDREQATDKVKTSDNKKLMTAKQLIDMIPKTKEELFSYEINWSIYDKHDLHVRLRPWISKKITEFLGEEEATLVDYIVSSTQNHVKASQMLELLQSILDDEAEMFVLKMWRMLIFEIKKVEAGHQLG